MIDMNTPQPATDDLNWNDIRWEEHDRVNPKLLRVSSLL